MRCTCDDLPASVSSKICSEVAAARLLLPLRDVACTNVGDLLSMHSHRGACGHVAPVERNVCNVMRQPHHPSCASQTTPRAWSSFMRCLTSCARSASPDLLLAGIVGPHFWANAPLTLLLAGGVSSPASTTAPPPLRHCLIDPPSVTAQKGALAQINRHTVSSHRCRR